MTGDTVFWNETLCRLMNIRVPSHFSVKQTSKVSSVLNLIPLWSSETSARTSPMTQSTVLLVQAFTVSHNRALPHWYRHWNYHTTEHCHIGTGTHSITQQSTATLVQTITVSHNRALPHWYRQSHYHTKEHCYIGTGTQNITQQSRPVLSS
jgi:hypothetical protein